jgi:hypothetical protein
MPQNKFGTKRGLQNNHHIEVVMGFALRNPALNKYEKIPFANISQGYSNLSSIRY